MQLAAKVVIAAVCASQFFFFFGVYIGWRLYKHAAARHPPPPPTPLQYVTIENPVSVATVSRRDLRRLAASAKSGVPKKSRQTS